MIKKKKKYIKVDKNISQKQVAKINIKNIIGIPVKKQLVRPRRSIKPVLTTQIVSKLVPIAPVSQNLIPPKTTLFTLKEGDFEKRLLKLEEGFKPVDTVKPKEKEEVKNPKKVFTDIFRPSKVPKPTKSSVLVEADRLMKERDDEERQLQERKFKEEEKEAIEKGFIETNPDPEIEDEGDIITEPPTSIGFFGIRNPFTSTTPATKSKGKKQFPITDMINLAEGYSVPDEFPPYEWFKSRTDVYGDYYSIPTEKKWKQAKELFDKGLKTKKDFEEEKEELPKTPAGMTSLASLGMGLRPYEIILGKGAYSNDNDGIYNDELQEIFRDKTNKFLPVIPSDKMDTLISMVNKNTKKFGWIQNTEPSTSKGRHWVAWFIDIPNLEINYYDSLAENEGLPSKQSLKGLKKIVDKIHPEYYLLLKYNQIREQNPMSKNCGYFSLKFIMDRYRNVPFKTATGYESIYGDEDVVDNYGKGEMKIKRFKNFL